MGQVMAVGGSYELCGNWILNPEEYRELGHIQIINFVESRNFPELFGGVGAISYNVLHCLK